MSQEIVLAGLYIGIMLYSVIFHEIAHGWAALSLGDHTARLLGRLSLRPMSHIDPFGSVLLPFALMVTTGVGFGYAKPVPYNPYNLRYKEWGEVLVALAGPLTNFALALVASVVATLIPLSLATKSAVFGAFMGVLGSGFGEFLNRFGDLATAMSGSLGAIFFGLLLIVVFWNSVLGAFNLLPIPPLDGSKVLFKLLSIPDEWQRTLEQYGFFILLAIIFIPSPITAAIGSFINWFLALFLGIAVM